MRGVPLHPHKVENQQKSTGLPVDAKAGQFEGGTDDANGLTRRAGKDGTFSVVALSPEPRGFKLTNAQTSSRHLKRLSCLFAFLNIGA